MKKLHVKNKNGFIITITISCLAIASGVGIGLFLAQSFSSPSVNYDNIDELSLEDNVDSLYTRYLKTEKGKIFSSYKPYEIVNIGLMNLKNHSSFRSTDVGAVLASGITQTIYGTTIRKGSAYFNESISKSAFVKVAKRFYQDNDGIDIYDGKKVVSEKEAVWKDEVSESLSLVDFESAWGKTFSRPSIYIISSKTVLDNGTITKDGTNYVISLNLDPIKSVVRYVRQMQMMSNLDPKKLPEFYSVQINYVLNENFEMVSSVVNEKYDVWKFGKHTSKSTITTTYYYDDSGIPDLNTNCQYEEVL